MEDMGAYIARINSINQSQNSNPRSGSSISDAQEGSSQEGNAYQVNDQTKGMAKMVGDSADKIISNQGMDVFLSSIRQDAPFNKNPLNDALDGSLVPVQGLNAFTNLHHIQGVGDVSLGNAAGLPSGVNLSEGISATTTQRGGQSHG